MKISVSGLLFMLFTVTSFSQDKVTAYATKKVEAINKELVSVDQSAELTEKQQQEITAIYVEKSKLIKKIKKEVIDEEEQKKQFKALTHHKKINDLLTKQQKAARKAARENKK